VPAFFNLHRFAAFVVLTAASAWIMTGEFSSVGGAEEPAANGSPAPESAAAEAQTAAAPVLRTVAVMEPSFVDHSRTIRLSGTTAADKRVVLAARSDGVINQLALVNGAAVAAGDMVMALEGPETLAQAEIAAIALEQRERELRVAERLFSGGNTPEIQLTSAQSNRDAAEAELNRAKAAVDRLQLRAPFAGIVEAVEVEMGEWVQTGAPVATILSLDPILVKAEVSEVDVDSVPPGSKASVNLVNGRVMEGTVRLVAREASAQTRTFPVEIMLPNPDSTLPAGMTAEVQLQAAPERATVVPRSVITLAETGEIGLRGVDADQVAHFVPVTILDDTEAGLVVTGVPENLRIIVAGQDLVRDGEKVIVAPGVEPTE
jgi:multidrug efflux system membrane fusion protein